MNLPISSYISMDKKASSDWFSVLFDDNTEKLSSILNEYKKDVIDTDQDLGFNIFALTSDLYYRENYHSDIIAAFLDPASKHNERNLFLDQFIDMINKAFAKKADFEGLENQSINLQDYKDAKVEREKGRIDILIKASGRCIIIENKMNNASDMNMQLPRYYKKMKDEKYEVDAIVYMPLNRYKFPNEQDWPDEIREIKEKMVVIPAYTSSNEQVCLVNDWIEPSVQSSNNIECISLLRQYSKLIKSLTPQSMADKQSEELMKMIFEKPEIVVEIKRLNELFDKVPESMALTLKTKIENIKQSDGLKFKDILNLKYVQWQTYCCVYNFNVNGITYQFFIYTFTETDKAYSFAIRNYDKESADVDWLEGSIDDLQLNIESESRNKSLYRRNFGICQEKEVIDLVTKILEIAAKHIKQD